MLTSVLHVRIVTPTEHAPVLLDLLEQDAAVCDVVHLPGAGRTVGRDLVLADVARERASGLLVELTELKLGPDVSISLLEIGAMVSTTATAAVAAAGGRPTDGVVWEEVEQSTAQRAGLSSTYLAFMIIATLIATVGVLVDSQVLLVGAMIAGPDFGPLAGLAVAVADRRPRLIRRSGVALAVGFGVAMALAFLFTVVVRALGAGPVTIGGADQPFTRFISHPDGFSAVIAALAGVGGLLAVTRARSGALIGILVSVTTLPAAANTAVALAYGDVSAATGAFVQLLINVVILVAAGVITYWWQRASFRGRISSTNLRETAGA